VPQHALADGAPQLVLDLRAQRSRVVAVDRDEHV
jgi:hypothetical protein